MNKYMELACEEARKSMLENIGGAFGAVIVDANGEIVSSAGNMVLLKNDPTQHAEIVAIQEACKKLGTYDLSGMTLYTSCEPCPMCLSASIWANIKTIYYGATRIDAEEIGFRDNFIYDHIEGKKNALETINLDRDECVKLFDEYKKQNKTIY